MSKHQRLANAVLWAAAILTSALLGSPPFFSLILLPTLATLALLSSTPAVSRAAGCRSSA